MSGAAPQAVEKGDFPPPRKLVPAIDPCAGSNLPEGNGDEAGGPLRDSEGVGGGRGTVDGRRAGFRPTCVSDRTSETMGAAPSSTGHGCGWTFASRDDRAGNRNCPDATGERADPAAAAGGRAELYAGAPGCRSLLHHGQREPPPRGTADGSAAEGASDAAREFYQKFVDERKGDRNAQADLARSYFRLSMVHNDLGQKNDAISSAEQARSLFDTLAGVESASNDLRVDRANTHKFIGMYYREVGRGSEALAEDKIAVDLFQKLVADSPTSAAYSHLLASSHSELAFACKSAGRSGEAKAAYERSRRLLEPLVEDDPKGWYRVDLAWAYHHLGLIATQTGNPLEAIADHRRALELRRSLVAQFPCRLMVPRFSCLEPDKMRQHRRRGRAHLAGRVRAWTGHRDPSQSGPGASR